MAETERGTLFDGSRTFSTPDVASKATGPGLYLDLTFSATSPGIIVLETGRHGSIVVYECALVEISSNGWIVIRVEGIDPIYAPGPGYSQVINLQVHYDARKTILSAIINGTPFSTSSKGTRRNFKTTEIYYIFGKSFQGTIIEAIISSESMDESVTPLFSMKFSKSLEFDKPPKPIEDRMKQPSLVEYLETLVNNRENSDISFKIEDKVVYAHKLILSRFLYFRTLFSGKFSSESSILLEDIEYDRFISILRYVYTEKYPTTDSDEENVNLCFYADRFGLDQLAGFAAERFRRSLKVDNISQMLSVAVEFPTHLLKSQCLWFISNNYPAVISKTDGFKDLQDIQLLREIMTTCSLKPLAAPKNMTLK